MFLSGLWSYLSALSLFPQALMSSPYNVTLISEPSVLFVGILKMLQVFGPFLKKKKKCLVQYLFCPLSVIDTFFFFHCRHTVAVSAALRSPPSWTLPPPKTCSLCFSGTASLKHAAGSTSSRGHEHKHLGNSFFRLITGKKT